jgi:hypothetical protein
MCHPSFFYPGNQAHDSQYQKHNILDAGKYRMFIKIKRDGSKVRYNPPYPVFDFFSRHLPHTRVSGGRCKRVGPWYGTVGMVFQNIIQHYPADKKKRNADEPIFTVIETDGQYFTFFFPAPYIPSIHAHNGVIKIQAAFGIEIPPKKTKPGIQNRIDDTAGVNQDIFFSGKHDAGNSK